MAFEFILMHQFEPAVLFAPVVLFVNNLGLERLLRWSAFCRSTLMPNESGLTVVGPTAAARSLDRGVFVLHVLNEVSFHTAHKGA